jgi:hypothetical protein
MEGSDDKGRSLMTTSKRDLEIFSDHCVFTRSIYLHAKYLFESSTVEDKALMERTASVFFSDLNRLLIEYVILQVCKITDPAQDRRKNDNQSIAFLLQHYDLTCDPAASKQLNELHARLQAFRDKLRPARDKLISHSDRQSILAGSPLGAATDQEWAQFWLDLQEVVRIIHQIVVGGPPFYLNGVTGLSDAGGLLKALRESAYFHELLNSGDPAVADSCIKLTLSGLILDA